MTTFNTGNAVPSADARDRFDNSQTFDEVINGTLTYYANRVGNNILSLKGMADLFNAAQLARANEYAADKSSRDTEFAQDQADREATFAQFLEGTGWSSLGAYAAGISIVSHTQTVDYLGQPYALKPSVPASIGAPYVTTGNWATEGVNFKLVGDNSLRQDLAADGGALTIGSNVVAVESIAALLVSPRKVGLFYNVAAYRAGTGVGGNTWQWKPASTKTPNYVSVLQVDGVATGRFEVIKLNRNYTAYEAGVYGDNTGTENRLRLSALYKSLVGVSASVKFPDENWLLDMSLPVIFPPDIVHIFGKGWCDIVTESPLLPASTAANPDGTFKVYGGAFGGGDPISGNRYSEGNYIYRGTSVWYDIKIRNTTGVTAALGYSAHGLITHGGRNFYFNPQVEDMPNTGLVTTMAQEAYYKNPRLRRNGLLGGGGARNGMSNTSTYSITSHVFPESDRSRRLTIEGGECSSNYEAGIQFANWPVVYIDGVNCTSNGDLAIEGDSAYAQLTQTRPNDRIIIKNCDCRGEPGKTNFSIGLLDGFNKDVYLDNNQVGNCIRQSIAANCSAVGSFNFDGPNFFFLDDNTLQNGCHAMYINAGRVNVMAGGVVRGAHDRSNFNAVLLSANNDLGDGIVDMGNFESETTFVNAVSMRTSKRLTARNVRCPTGRSFAQVSVAGDGAVIDIAGVRGALNTGAGTDQGLIRLLYPTTGPAFTVAKLLLSDINSVVNPATRYPIASSPTAPAGSILELFSHSNFWKGGYTYPGGERLTAVVGLAAKTSAFDMPALI